MGIIDGLLDRIASRLNKSIQGVQSVQSYRDYHLKGESYSVEAEISEALTDLMLMLSSMPISGESERALWLDDLSDQFFRDKAKKVISTAFLTGDSIVVPSWNGRNIQNVIVPNDDFIVMDKMGDEITSCAYVVDVKQYKNETYRLMQAIELVPYTANDSTETYANRYRMFVSRNDSILTNGLGVFEDWKDQYDAEWYIPNVDRLLIARYKSFTVDPMNLNSVKGVPICFGASDPIAEIHYILEQMHNEFGLSEKAIIANKRAFRKEAYGSEVRTVLPRGRERLFMEASWKDDADLFHEWAPDIRYQAYLDNLDQQEKLVEKAVGVSGGILSMSNDMNYQNVDNVRKSQQKTMGFITNARKQAEKCLLDLVYAWDVLANYYGINPIGDYDVNFDWSDEYIETFGDRQNAILAGEAIGATDAVDYRMFVMDESPETAKQRVEEIRQQKKENQAMFFAESTAQANNQEDNEPTEE